MTSIGEHCLVVLVVVVMGWGGEPAPAVGDEETRGLRGGGGGQNDSIRATRIGTLWNGQRRERVQMFQSVSTLNKGKSQKSKTSPPKWWTLRRQNVNFITSRRKQKPNSLLDSTLVANYHNLSCQLSSSLSLSAGNGGWCPQIPTQKKKSKFVLSKKKKLFFDQFEENI